MVTGDRQRSSSAKLRVSVAGSPCIDFSTYHYHSHGVVPLNVSTPFTMHVGWRNTPPRGRFHGVLQLCLLGLAQGVNSLKSPYLFATASAEIVEQLIAEPELLAEMDDDSVTEMSIKVASKIIESQENSDYFNIEYTQNVPENVTIGFDLEMDGYEYDEVARHQFN